MVRRGYGERFLAAAGDEIGEAGRRGGDERRRVGAAR
jgi:hypothetical protein